LLLAHVPPAGVPDSEAGTPRHIPEAPDIVCPMDRNGPNNKIKTNISFRRTILSLNNIHIRK
jgi:hypothetical protein